MFPAIDYALTPGSVFAKISAITLAKTCNLLAVQVFASRRHG